MKNYIDCVFLPTLPPGRKILSPCPFHPLLPASGSHWTPMGFTYNYAKFSVLPLMVAFHCFCPILLLLSPILWNNTALVCCAQSGSGPTSFHWRLLYCSFMMLKQ